MIKFAKAHAYGNDFIYVRNRDVAPGVALDSLAREVCRRHTGIGADGLILYEPTPDGASMRLLNADGSHSEVSGNGVRGLAALLLQGDDRKDAAITIHSEGGVKQLVRTAREGSRQTFRAAMGLPADLRQVTVTAAGESLQLAVMNFGNPQCVALGPLPDEERFNRLGPALEHHAIFPARSNVEFAHVESPDRVQDPDLGARRRSDDLFRHRVVRVADRGGGVRRRRARRDRRGARRRAARRVARRQRLSHRLGGGRRRRNVASLVSAVLR